MNLFKREDRPGLSFPTQKLILKTNQQLLSPGTQQSILNQSSQNFLTANNNSNSKQQKLPSSKQSSSQKMLQSRRQSNSGLKNNNINKQKRGSILDQMTYKQQQLLSTNELNDEDMLKMIEGLEYEEDMDPQEYQQKLQNLLHAIQIRKQRTKHSDFSLLLDQVNDRIYMYKSLFLDRQPKFIKQTSFTQRYAIEKEEKRLMRQIEDERLKKAMNNLEKKKKSQFYDNLSKKASKKYKQFFTNDRKGGILHIDQTIQEQDKILPLHPLGDLDIDDIQQSLQKEQSRRDRLYAQKPKALGDNLLSLGIRKESSQALSSKDTTSQNIELPVSLPKNDIAYLQNMKKSVSLPYLIRTQEKSVIQSYLNQRVLQIQNSMNIVESDQEQQKIDRKKKKILKLAEQKFLKLNQKASVKKHVICNKGDLKIQNGLAIKIIDEDRSLNGSIVNRSRVYNSSVKMFPSIGSNNMTKHPQLKDILQANQTSSTNNPVFSVKKSIDIKSPKSNMYKTVRHNNNEIKDPVIKSIKVKILQKDDKNNVEQL